MRNANYKIKLLLMRREHECTAQLHATGGASQQHHSSHLLLATPSLVSKAAVDIVWRSSNYVYSFIVFSVSRGGNIFLISRIIWMGPESDQSPEVICKSSQREWLRGWLDLRAFTERFRFALPGDLQPDTCKWCLRNHGHHELWRRE